MWIIHLVTQSCVAAVIHKCMQGITNVCREKEKEKVAARWKSCLALNSDFLISCFILCYCCGSSLQKREGSFLTVEAKIFPGPENPSEPQLFAWSSTRLIWTFYIWTIRFYSLYCWYILSWPDILTSQLPLWLWLESAKNKAYECCSSLHKLADSDPPVGLRIFQGPIQLS